MALPNPDDLWAKLDAGKGGFTDAEIDRMTDLLYVKQAGKNWSSEDFERRQSQLALESFGNSENQTAGETITPEYARNGTWWAPLTHTTETSNPDRPRTVGAGYDVTRYILTVQFRDMTLYNYYDVPPEIWSEFRSAMSKGQYMQRDLDSWPEKGPVTGHSQNYYTGRGKRARTTQVNRSKPFGGLI
jgi:hypothetical protein